MGKVHWTEEMYAIVREGWPAGKSAQVLADAINKISRVVISRNAVVSRARFLNVTTPNQKVNQFAFKPSKPRPPRPINPAKSIGKIATEVERRDYDLQPELDASGNPYTMETIQPHQCQFIIGPPSAYAPMCGKTAHQFTRWCKHHFDRCTVVPTPYYKKPEPRYR